MNEHNVWTIVPYNKTMPIVPVKWIFGIKDDGRKRARLIAIGCRDKQIYTPAETASPTPSADTTKWLIAHCSYMESPLIHLDLITAFLQANINDEKMYLYHREGKETEKPKSLKSTEQSMAFQRLPNVGTWVKNIIILLLYIDDI